MLLKKLWGELFSRMQKNLFLPPFYFSLHENKAEREFYLQLSHNFAKMYISEIF